MKFIDLFYSIAPDSYVFVENLDENPQKRKKRKPCKAENVSFRDIRNWKDLDVYEIAPYCPFRGRQLTVLYIRIGNIERVQRELDVRKVLRQHDQFQGGMT